MESYEDIMRRYDRKIEESKSSVGQAIKEYNEKFQRNYEQLYDEIQVFRMAATTDEDRTLVRYAEEQLLSCKKEHQSRLGKLVDLANLAKDTDKK